MNKANYIIFHPDNKRQSIEVQATAMVKNKLLIDWKGNIYVDPANPDL